MYALGHTYQANPSCPYNYYMSDIAQLSTCTKNLFTLDLNYTMLNIRTHKLPNLVLFQEW